MFYFVFGVLFEKKLCNFAKRTAIRYRNSFDLTCDFQLIWFIISNELRGNSVKITLKRFYIILLLMDKNLCYLAWFTFSMALIED